jgi:acyl carrier protein
MEKVEITSRLTPIFRKIFGDEQLELTDELSALDVENWDSLTHMLLITEIESDFSIKFKIKPFSQLVGSTKNLHSLCSLFLGSTFTPPTSLHSITR